ncbi:hypothetical protein [Phreatobacter stygius]|uniref:Uncharacterized protein n=1 Tax=Phreatobacter stygius TaxID=1940610 RepID=A0A4D7B120_9HYPH|nr:hypothetical protein [Phreatobacter stygius]QCI63730.1 hypothetical protein E8M01_05420 [Phreatobacter stygius]
MAGIDRRAAIGALVPLVVTLGAIVATYVTGTTARSIETAVGSPYLIFGFFADRFPALAFAIIFVLVRLLVVAIVATRPNILFRLLLLIPAVLLVLVAALYPTFGGIIARPGFMGGGFSMLDGRITGADAGFLLGGAISGVMLGLVTGFARGLIDWSWGFTWGRLARVILAFVAYAALGAVLAWGWATFERAGALFPRAPLTIIETIGLIGLIIVASAPQIVVAALSDAARRD